MRAVLLGFAGLCGLCACGQDAGLSPVQASPSRDIRLKLVSPLDREQPARADSVTLAWTHDSLTGTQVAVVNDSLPVSKQAIRSTSLSVTVPLAEGANRFVLRLSDGSEVWADTVTIVRGALPPAPSVTLLTPRVDTAHAWADSVISVRWKLSGASLDSVRFGGQLQRSVQDSLAYEVGLRPGPDTLLLSGSDVYGRTVMDTVIVGRGFYTGLADPLANLVVGKWQGDTVMPVPQAMRDSLASSFSAYKLSLDSALDIRYRMTILPEGGFRSVASLHFKATSGLLPGQVMDDWVDSIYHDEGTWAMVGDSVELRRVSCSKALSPYVAADMQKIGHLIDGDPSTHALSVASNRTATCAPEVSRIRVVFEGAAWPVTVSGLLPGQDVAMLFARSR